MNPSKARAKRCGENAYYERYCFIQVTCRAATRTRKARHGTKIYEQWNGPKKRVRVNNLVKWDRVWWHKYTKQARSRSPI